MQEFLTQTGRSIYLARKFASGGEGEIYEINNSPELLAKIYLPAILQKRQRELEKKLPLMISLTNDLLLSNTAWPLDALYEKKSKRLVGFVMKKFEGHKEIHLLYSPKSRIREFPDADWRLLIHTAINITRTFELIHNHGHVIGDINAKSVLVSKQAITKLIDCDSFQINAGVQPLTCDVGVPEYTPPELQGKSLHGLVRNQSHDSFGLAVLIFHLLFMGRHPFAGEYLGQGNKDLADSIKEYRFAYGPGASSRYVRQPPFSPPLTMVSNEVAALFERAFTTANRRPSTAEWASGLRNLSQNLTKCGVNAGHHYLRSLAECPWCKLERTAGLKLFLGTILQNLGTAGFDLAKVWQEISVIGLPPDSFPATAQQSFQPTLSQLLNPFGTIKSVGIPTAIATLQRILLAANLAILLWIAGSIWWVLNPIQTGLLGCVVAFFCLFLPYQNYARQKKLVETEKSLIEARSNQRQLLAQLQTGKQTFQQKQAELSKIKQQYENLSVELHQKLADLEKNSKQRQLEKFLDNFDLYDASISGIGPQRKATLISYGIETAADVHYSKIQGVIPGFGPSNTSKLVAWRQSLERRFVYDPRKGVDPADKQAVEQEIASKRRAFEAELNAGPTRLKQLVEQITNTQNQIRRDIELTAKDCEAAQKKIDFLQALRKGFVPLWSAMIGLTIWWLIAVFR